jgi:MotA/TolQ/ExbB proton channel family
MLANFFIDHHLEGGIYYMAPLTILFAVNIAIFIYLVTKKDFTSIWLEVFRHIGMLILVLGVLGTLAGFIQMFDALESIKEDLPRQVISGGVKVALITAFYGTVYFCITQATYIGLKVLARN